jgi:hypothetical protein
LYIEGAGINNKILSLIKSHAGVQKVKPGPESKNGFYVIIEEENDSLAVAEQLNRLLAKKNVFLSRLEMVQPSLEELFMKITRGS